MSEWSLAQLLASLHDDIQQRLATARRAIAHPVGKGAASESVWVKLLETYLPMRYQVASAYIVDSAGQFSDQIDVVVFDRQYSPFIFKYEGQTIVPAESVYAVFEAKQTLTAEVVGYAQRKTQSVRTLQRTSLPIPHAGGVFSAKPLSPILGGILSLDSDWSPPLGKSLLTALESELGGGRLDLGCVAEHGTFALGEENVYLLTPQDKPATAFLFELISRLQAKATVPMIDINAYAAWLL